METTKKAIQRCDELISSIQDIGENRRTNAMIGKVIAIKADLSAMETKEELLATAPNRRKKKQ